MDDSSRGALTAAELQCGSCGAELPPNSKFCNECGAPVTQVSRSAEYKQVTVLFADVVHSMDVAAAVGPERLREIMADLADQDADYGLCCIAHGLDPHWSPEPHATVSHGQNSGVLARRHGVSFQATPTAALVA